MDQLTLHGADLTVAVALLQVMFDQKLFDGWLIVKPRPLLLQLLQKLLPLPLVFTRLPRQPNHHLQQRQQQGVGPPVGVRMWPVRLLLMLWVSVSLRSLSRRQDTEGVVTVVPSLLQLVLLLETERQRHQGEEPMAGGRRRALVVIVTGPAQFELESLGVEQRTQGLLVPSHPQ